MRIESKPQNLEYGVTSVVIFGDDAIKKTEEDKPDLILMSTWIQSNNGSINTAEIICAQ